MIHVRIDVAKDKHDCFIVNSDSEVLFNVFTIANNMDARTIASMIMSDVSFVPYSDKLYHNEDLKTLTRYRFDKVAQRAKLKQSVSRLVNILFPELETLVFTLHGRTVYVLLQEFPSAAHCISKFKASHKFIRHLI